jgi:hypothetical protein
VIAICFLYLLFFEQGILQLLVFQTIILTKEDGCRRNTRYLCKNMRSMAIIACKLLNVSSNKIEKQILQQ